jgi:Na+-driven multidrug efflux pump
MESINAVQPAKQEFSDEKVLPVKQCLSNIFGIAIPTVVYFFSTVVLESINLMFVGHLGDELQVSGVALGVMYLYTFGLTVVFGFNSVIETLASQTFG